MSQDEFDAYIDWCESGNLDPDEEETEEMWAEMVMDQRYDHLIAAAEWEKM
jgi:hypothetical protein